MNRSLRVFSASVLTAVLLLSGCSSAGKGTATSGSAAASAAATTAGEAVASPIDGILAGYSGEILSVKATDGKTYEFVVPDPSVFTTADALNIGDDVEVTFTGTVSGTDTTQATVTKVEDKSATSQTVQTIVGTVTDATMLLGSGTGAFLGFVFGLTSLLINTFAPTVTSFVFSPFITVGGIHGNFASLLIVFVPRILLGWLSPVIYRQLCACSHFIGFASMPLRMNWSKTVSHSSKIFGVRPQKFMETRASSASCFHSPLSS